MKWIKASERLPERDGTYICKKTPVSNDDVYVAETFFAMGAFKTAHTIIEWLDESTAPVEGEMSPRVAKLILAIRNELVKPDALEAYHLLYQIASPNFDKQGDVWEEIEQIASQPSPPNNSNGG